MTTTITYFPDKGIYIDDKMINWDFDRFKIRNLLGNNHKEDDRIIDLSKYYDGNDEYNIIQRRDVYENYNGKENSFFLNYSKDDLLNEVEIHGGYTILIGDIKIDFDMNFDDAVSLLQSISIDNRQISDGEYFFKDLKLTIAHNEFMGGEGEELAYFYCSNNVDHLNDE